MSNLRATPDSSLKRLFVYTVFKSLLTINEHKRNVVPIALIEVRPFFDVDFDERKGRSCLDPEDGRLGDVA